MRFLGGSVLWLCLGYATGNCQAPNAQAGSPYTWVNGNPALVAPVTISYNTQPYDNIMMSTFTGKSIRIEVPPDLQASFTIVPNKTSSGTPEQYTLTAIELRRPGQQVSGSAQAMSHVLEMALVFQETTGTGYYANVISGFTVSDSYGPDVLTPLVDQATLPSKTGQTSPVLMSIVQQLYLGFVFDNATFSHYWTTLPTDCQGVTVPARQFMRATALSTLPGTYHSIAKALGKAPNHPPQSSPKTVFLLGTCDSSSTTCSPLQPEDLSGPVAQAQALVGQQQTQLNDGMTSLNQVLTELNATLLSNHTNGSNATNASNQSNGSSSPVYAAIQSRNNLWDSEQELISAMTTLNQLQAWVNQTLTVQWDADAPAKANAVASTASGSQSPSSSLLSVSSEDNHGIRLAATSCSEQGPGSSLKLPHAVDIAKAANHVDAGTTALLGLVLRFTPPAQDQSSVLLAHNHDHLRLAAPQGEALLSFSWRGVQFPIHFVDVKVPGEHLIKGQPSALELQLRHQSEGGGDSVGLSILFDESIGLAEQPNQWLQLLLDHVPRPGKEALVRTVPLAEVHGALRRGLAAHYYTYDGLSSRTPCGPTKWFVLEERGWLDPVQLTALAKAMSFVEPPETVVSERPALVSLLQSQSSSEGEPAPLSRGRLSLRASQTRPARAMQLKLF